LNELNTAKNKIKKYLQRSQAIVILIFFEVEESVLFDDIFGLLLWCV
jgi:hypothetical protein